MKNQKKKRFYRVALATTVFLLVVLFFDHISPMKIGDFIQPNRSGESVATVHENPGSDLQHEGVALAYQKPEVPTPDGVLLRVSEAGTSMVPDKDNLIETVQYDLMLHPFNPLPEMMIELTDRFVNDSVYTSDAYLGSTALAAILLQIDESLRSDTELQGAIASHFSYTPIPGKTVYFTIDDGPSRLTDKFLEIFEQHEVKATFFLVGRNVAAYPDKVLDIYNRGHLIANHSYSHNYNTFYASKENFRSELKRWDEAVSKALDIPYHSDIFRFPGGSSYSKARQYRDFIQAEGYQYYDWNCLNGDAQIRDKSANSLFNYMVSTFKNQNEVILLIHDTDAKQTTVDMLERAIIFFKEQGYEFKTLDQKG